MASPRPHTLGPLADLVGADVLAADRHRPVRGIATLADAGPDDLSFLTHPRYRDQLAATRAGAVLAVPGTAVPGSVALVAHPEPYAALATLMTVVHPEPAMEPGVHPAAWVDPGAGVEPTAAVGPGAVVQADARVGAGAMIGAGAVIGEGVVIGARSHVGERAVVIAGTRVGADCRLGPGAVVGSAGFGYAPTAEGLARIPQAGIVILEDGVDIGANTTVDRATLGATRLGAGAKLDNLVQIGHNVVVGRGAVIVAQSGIAGSTRLGDGVQVGGQVGIVGHLLIGAGARIGAGSGVGGDIPAGVDYSGAPAFEHARWRRSVAAFKRLPDLLRRVRELEREVASLRDTMKGPEGSEGEGSR